jgi:hypothetical protein
MGGEKEKKMNAVDPTFGVISLHAATATASGQRRF